MKPNFKAVIVARNQNPVLLVAVLGGLRDRLFEVPLSDAQIEVDSRFLSENLTIEFGGKTIVLRFPRGRDGRDRNHRAAPAADDQLRRSRSN